MKFNKIILLTISAILLIANLCFGSILLHEEKYSGWNIMVVSENDSLSYNMFKGSIQKNEPNKIYRGAYLIVLLSNKCSDTYSVFSHVQYVGHVAKPTITEVKGDFSYRIDNGELKKVEGPFELNIANSTMALYNTYYEPLNDQQIKQIENGKILKYNISVNEFSINYEIDLSEVGKALNHLRQYCIEKKFDGDSRGILLESPGLDL